MYKLYNCTSETLPPPHHKESIMYEDFIKNCKQLGEDITAIQGSGGNTSMKLDDIMYIKASGTWLADAQKTNIFTCVSVKSVLEVLNNDGENFVSIDSDIDSDNVSNIASGINSDVSSSAGSGKGSNIALRPSIETPLHALLPHAVVIHAHCVNTIAYSVRHDSMERLSKVLCDFSWQLVPYARPGLPLAKAVQKAIQNADDFDVLILENHGIIVGGSDEHDAFSRFEAVRKALSLPARPILDFEHDFLVSKNDMQWIIPKDILLHSIATDIHSLNIATQGVLYPDHVVFLGPFIPVAHEDESVAQALLRLKKAWGEEPKYLVYPKKGIMVSPTNGHGHTALLQALTLVCGRIEANTKVRTLNSEDVSSLMHWDAEKYRQTLESLREI